MYYPNIGSKVTVDSDDGFGPLLHGTHLSQEGGGRVEACASDNRIQSLPLIYSLLSSTPLPFIYLYVSPMRQSLDLITTAPTKLSRR